MNKKEKKSSHHHHKHSKIYTATIDFLFCKYLHSFQVKKQVLITFFQIEVFLDQLLVSTNLAAIFTMNILSYLV